MEGHVEPARPGGRPPSAPEAHTGWVIACEWELISRGTGWPVRSVDFRESNRGPAER